MAFTCMQQKQLHTKTALDQVAHTLLMPICAVRRICIGNGSRGHVLLRTRLENSCWAQIPGKTAEVWLTGHAQDHHLIIGQGLCTSVHSVLLSRALEEIQQVLTPLICSSLPIKETPCSIQLCACTVFYADTMWGLAHQCELEGMHDCHAAVLCRLIPKAGQ